MISYSVSVSRLEVVEGVSHGSVLHAAGEVTDLGQVQGFHTGHGVILKAAVFRGVSGQAPASGGVLSAK